MGKLMRARDWTQSTLGPVAGWPQSLRTAVSICLNSRFPMLIWWGSDLIMLYNDAYRPILGTTKHPQALGQRGAACWPEIWPIIGPMLEGVLTRGEATWSDDQLLVLDRNGYLEECYFTFSYSPIRDEKGEVGGIFTAVTETSTQVISNRRLRTLRELAARTVVAKTAKTACTLAVQALADNRADLPFALLYLLDDSGQELHLMGATGIMAGEAASPERVVLAAPSAGWPFAQVMEQGQAQLVTDLAVRFGALPGGPWLASPTQAQILPILAPSQGQPTGVLIAGISPRRTLDADYQSFLTLVAGQVATAVADVRAYEAERKRAEALAALDRTKSAFFSNISHEFRTPLTLMLGPLHELLQRNQGLPPADRIQIELVYGNSLRLLKLVNSLLDFSQLQEGRLEAYYEPTSLATYTADLASLFRSAIEGADLQLNIACPPLSQLVYVDRAMWEKIVLNLLSNAFKFTLTGAITVSLHGQPDQVILSVSDTGIGIPAAELPHIFSRFHRVRGVIARTHEGSGIGLALVQELSKLHGGTVQVSSVEGVGSTFTVAIPTGTVHLPPDRIGAPRPLPATLHSARPYIEEAQRWLPTNDLGGSPLDTILDFGLTTQAGDHKAEIGNAQSNNPKSLIVLADDNADMRTYLTRLLSQWYRVEAVADGMTALAAIRMHKPDLVLTDVIMPKMDGFALLKAVRDDPHLCAIPIILLSARAGEESRIEGLKAGADDYLVKPFVARELLARVEAHLALQRLRQESLAALRQSEARLQRVIEGSNDGFWDWNVQSDVMVVSPRWFAILGYSAEELTLNQEMLDRLVHPDDLETVKETVTAVIEGSAGQDRYRLRHRFIGKDGTVRWVLARGSITQRDEQGRVLLLSGTITDITARKAAEDALIESEARFRMMADSTPTMIWVTDATGFCSFLNHSWYAFTGQSAANSQGMGWLEAVHHADRTKAESIFLTANANQAPFKIEYRLRRHDGQYRWVIDTAVPRLGEDGQFLGYIGSVTDIHERKQAEEVVQQSEQHLRDVIDGLAAFIGVLTPAGILLKANRPGLQAAGLRTEEVVGYPFSEGPWWSYDSAVQSQLRAAIARAATGEHVRYDEMMHLAVDQYIVVDLMLSPILEDGRVTHVVASAIDITQRKLMEQALRENESKLRTLTETLEQRVSERTAELERSNQELDQFAYIASHDLKTPLRGIHNLATWIAEDAGAVLPAPSVEHLMKLRGRVQRMERLLDDLLAYSRVGRHDGKDEIVHTKALIEEVLYLLAPPAGFTIHLAEDLPTLVTPHTPLELVFRNLISNAIKHHHHPAQGQVWVRAQTLGDYVEFCIRDNGPGIDPQHHERIFRMFQVLRPRDELESSGIGLAIVKKAVEQHKGTIRLESAPGQGATFYFTWPKHMHADEIESKW